MQVDVTQCHALGVTGVLEAHVVEVDGAVHHGVAGVRGAREVGLLDEHGAEAACALLGHGHDDEDHREHHEAHEHREAIGDEGGHLTDVHGGAIALDGGARAKEQHEGVHDVDGERHEGHAEGEDALDMHEVMVEALGGRVELLLLIAAAHEGLDHTDAADVLLDGVVEDVVLVEDAAEHGHDLDGDAKDGGAQQHGDDHVHHGHAAARDEGHHDGEDDHERGADGGADDHHVCELHVRGVGGETRHERARGEAVDVGEREALDGREEVVAEVARESRGRNGAGDARACAAGERDDGQGNQDEAVVANGCHVCSLLQRIDELRRDERDDALDGDLADHEDGCDDRVPAELADALGERGENAPVAELLGGGVTLRL